ncbi:hypothetical protein C0995_009978 [Termitomyces sp. Mi166|nr:hypothetical protein C0995_009978 [Termitomyces sp. Mi166\
MQDLSALWWISFCATTLIQNMPSLRLLVLKSICGKLPALGFTWHPGLREHNPVIDWSKGHIPFADIDLLDPSPLAFPHREALYEEVQSMESETQLEDGCESEFISAPDSESLDEAIKVGDRIYAATLHPLPMAAEIQAS